MKKLIVAVAALAFLVAPAQAKGAKSITAQVDGWTVTGKKCHLKRRCDFKLLVKRSAGKQATKYGGSTTTVVTTTESGRGGGGRGDYGRDGRGRGEWGGGGGGYRPGYHHRPGYRPGYNVGGAEVAAGFVIGSAVSNWLFPPKPEVVVVERPVAVRDEAPPEGEGVVLTPWTSDWYSYCGNKYQTFDAKTGFYITAGGGKAFCK